jgi:glycosyltransferase involved in cell wall biosynthesis
MTTMAFVYLARNAGWTYDDLAWDIRSLARPGDHVVVVDDGSTDDTPARVGRFAAFEGWGADVAVTTIITGAVMTDDLGLALNLALAALAVPGQAPDRVTILAAGSRIDTAILTAARAQAEAEDLDLLIFPLRQWSLDQDRVIDPPGHAAWVPLPDEPARVHALR